MAKIIFYPDAQDLEFLDFVSDRDTWRWALNGSKEFNEALSVYGHLDSLEALDAFYHEFKVDPHGHKERLISDGKCFMVQKDATVKMLTSRGRIVRYYWSDDIFFNIVILNSTIYMSEVGNYLINNQEERIEETIAHSFKDVNPELIPDLTYHFVVVYNYKNPTSKSGVAFSIRSENNYTSPDGTHITSDMIAKSFGGGGHAKAAGFFCPDQGQNFFRRTSLISHKNTPSMLNLTIVVGLVAIGYFISTLSKRNS